MKNYLYLLRICLCLLCSYPNFLAAQVDKFFTVSEDIDFRPAFDNELNGKYCFMAGGDGRVWVSDGTSSGTLPISPRLSSVENIIKVENKVFFVERESPSDLHWLYVSDGTPEGTQKLKIINKFRVREGNVSVMRPLRSFVVNQGLVFFIANGGGDIHQLWRSDGTVEGTYALPVAFDLATIQGELLNLRQVSPDKLIFQLSEGERWEMWESDGTAEGTQKVDISLPVLFPNITDRASFFDEIAVSEGVIYSMGSTSLGRNFLLRTDFTQAGTWNMNALLSNPQFIITVKRPFIWKNNLYCFAFKWNQTELYRVSPADENPVLIKTLEYSPSWNIRSLEVTEDYFVFSAPNTFVDDELWVSDGTTEGTKLLKDIWKGAGSGFSTDTWFAQNTPFVFLEGYLYFFADNGINGRELWRTDGTAEHTQLVADIEKGVFGALTATDKMINIGGKLYFAARDGKGRRNLCTYTHQENIPPLPNPSPWREQEWYQTIGITPMPGTSGTIYPEGLAGDSQSNIYITGNFSMGSSRGRFLFYDQGQVLEEHPEMPNAIRGQYCAKFDKFGNLIWAKHIGETNSFPPYTALTVDKEDRLYLAGAFYQNAILDDWNANQNSPGFYLAKYNTDETRLWTVKADFASYGDVFKILTDNQQNIYVTGLYRGFQANFGEGVVLTSDSSPRFFLAKYSPQGRIIWAKNLEHIGNNFGMIADLRIDAQQNIYTLMTQGTSRTWSSCKFRDWGSRVDCFQPDGSLKWSSEFTADDLTIARSLDISPLGEVFVVGRFRGELQAGSFNLVSDRSGECNLNTGFLIRLDSRDGRIKSAQSDNPTQTDLFQITFLPDNTYYVSGTQVNTNAVRYENYNNRDFPTNALQLFIKRYDYLGNLLKERYFNTNDRENPRFLIDKDNYIVLHDGIRGRLDTIPNAIQNGHRNAFLLRIKNDALAYQIFEPNYPDTFVIAPNPTEGEILIKNNRPEWIQYELLIYNSIGQNINYLKKTDNSEFLQLDLSNLPKGTYILVFYNAVRRISKRVVKY